MTDSPEGVVRAYIAGFGKSVEEDRRVYSTYLAENVQYFSGTTMLRSRAETLEFVAKAVDAIGLASWRAELINLAVNGNTVLTERIDVQIDPDGKEVLRVPIMGVFKVENGQIVEWRDYWDVRPLLDYGADYRRRKGHSPHAWGDPVGGAQAAAAASLA